VTALDAGASGNGIQVRVDYATANPDSTFNIAFIRSSDGRAEQYQNVSMNSADARYLPDLVNGVSQLVKITRDVPGATLNGLAAGHLDQRHAGRRADPARCHPYRFPRRGKRPAAGHRQHHAAGRHCGRHRGPRA
jgi:hypothetical protein